MTHADPFRLDCRPQYILQPTAWTKVLPPHFLEARQTALQRAEEFEMATNGGVGMQQGSPMQPVQNARSSVGAMRQIPDNGTNFAHPPDGMTSPEAMDQHQHAMQMQQMGMQDGAAMMMQQQLQQHPGQYQQQEAPMDEGMAAPTGQMQMEDQPPSLSHGENHPDNQAYYPSNQQGMMNGMNSHQDPQMQPNMNEYPSMEYNYGGQSNGYQDHQLQMGYDQQHAGQQMGGYHPDQQGMNGYGNMDPGMNMSGYDDPASPNYGQGQFSPAQYSESQYDDGQQYQHQNMQGMVYDQDPTMHQDPNSQYYDQHGMAMPNDQYYVDSEQMPNDQGYGEQPYSPDENGEGYFSPEHGDQMNMQPDDEADPNPISPQTQDSSMPYNYSADATEEPDPSVGPISPNNESEVNPKSEFSVQSQAMKGARELLKRNRQKRLEMVARQANSDPAAEPRDGPGVQDFGPGVQDFASPKSEASAATWESGSEVTESVLSGTSSAWTESSDAPGRSSRRALILQMAKARMKGNKGSGSSVAGDTPRSEIMGTYSITEEEKKLDGSMEEDKEGDPIIEDNATDIDIAGDLD